jgi:hypothetical protein
MLKMKQFVTMVFVGFTAICIAQNNAVPLEFVSETNETVLLTPMNDSLKIEYPAYQSIAILYLDTAVMEVEGYAFYSGTCGSFEVNVQFIEESECAIDSECKELNLGLCKLKETNPFKVGNSSYPGNDKYNESGSGSGRNRKMIRKPNTDAIQSDETCVIVLKVNVDGEGNIVGVPIADRGQTTTTNSALIKKVIEVVKKETKYAKANGKAMESMMIRIKLTNN